MNKKRILANLLPLVAIMVALCVCSCSKSSDKDDDDEEDKTEYSEKAVRRLLDKIDAGEMKESDWNKAIDQLDAVYEKAAKEIEDAMDSSDTYDEFDDKASSILGNYELVDDLYEKLKDSEYDMDSKTYKRFEKVVEKGQERIGKLKDKADRTLEVALEVAPAEDYYAPAETEAVEAVAYDSAYSY